MATTNTKATGVAYADPAFDSVQVGSSTVPVQITSAGVLNGSYASASGTTGDTRLDYKKLTFTAAGSGETLRAYSVVQAANSAAGGTINGAHITCDIDGSGTISGAANAIRATLGGTSTNPGGTIAAIQADSNFASGGTWTNASFIRCTNSGTGTIGKLLNLPKGMLTASVGTASAFKIACVADDGTAFYLLASS